MTKIDIWGLFDKATGGKHTAGRKSEGLAITTPIVNGVFAALCYAEIWCASVDAILLVNGALAYVFLMAVGARQNRKAPGDPGGDARVTEMVRQARGDRAA